MGALIAFRWFREKQMPFKDTLLQLSSYPNASPASTIEQGVAIAALLQANVTVVCPLKSGPP